jgi:hypothetical protein
LRIEGRGSNDGAPALWLRSRETAIGYTESFEEAKSLRNSRCVLRGFLTQKEGHPSSQSYVSCQVCKQATRALKKENAQIRRAAALRPRSFLFIPYSRTSEKMNSGKSIYEILHSPGPMRPETPDSPGPVPNPKPYILWCCIKMQPHECRALR